MKAILDGDRIIGFSSGGDVEVGPIPKGVGLERLRWDGEKLVDLWDLDEMWVKPKGNSFSMHAVEVPGSRKVRMKYKDRKMSKDDLFDGQTTLEREVSHAKIRT